MSIYTYITNSSELVTSVRMTVALARNTISSIWSCLGAVVTRGTVLTREALVWLWTLTLFYCHSLTGVWVVALQSNVQ